jgi:uncharacterized membrane protein
MKNNGTYYKGIKDWGCPMEVEQIVKAVAPYIIHSLELIGIFIITVATIKCFYEYLKTIPNADKNQIKIDYAESIALAIEFKLAGEIIKTVVISRVEDLYILGAVILLRVILTFVLQWEIREGTQNKQNTWQDRG